MAAVLMIMLLRLNGLDLGADDDAAEEAIVGLAAGPTDLDAFTGWVGGSSCRASPDVHHRPSAPEPLESDSG